MSDQWIERAQSAEARIQTLKDAYEPAINRIKDFKRNFGIKERDNGMIDIDFDKFCDNLGHENLVILLEIIQSKLKT